MPAGLHRTYGAHHLHFITCSCYRRLANLRTRRARDRFLEILEETRQQYRFVVLGYVVMPEHFHLLISEPPNRNSFHDYASSETAHGTRTLAEKEMARPATGIALWRRFAFPVLASSVLRLQCVDNEEEDREAQVYASKSGQAGTRNIAGRVALEQLRFLLSE